MTRGARVNRDRGSAVIAVAVVLLLVCAVGAGSQILVRWRLVAAQRRIASTQLRWLSRAALSAVGGWFEAPERGSLTAPPHADSVDRDQRVIDLDGDGDGALWRDAAAPWNCRYKESHADRIFRPPDALAPEDRFVGGPDGPDVVITAPSGAGESTLVELALALAPGFDFRIARIAFFRPPDRAGPRALAAVEVVAERRVAGGPPARVAARGEIVRVDWGRLDRPLVVAGDADMRGAGGWGRGEALIGGRLAAGVATVDGWPGGIPWLAPDRPVREDADGDGAPDDADLDGVADWREWRDAPGDTPDPWWRARIGGEGPLAAPTTGACQPLFPFGPRATPPQPVSKSADRSGLFVRCPTTSSAPVLDPAWLALPERGVRGAWSAVEVTGGFRRNGAGATQALDALLPGGGGLVVIHSADDRTSPVSIRLAGAAGAILLARGSLELEGGGDSARQVWAPGDPRDTRGAERPGGAGDDHLAVHPSTSACESWSVGDWAPDDAATAAALGHPCADAGVSFAGLLGAAGETLLSGPAVIVGQLRAGSLRIDGETGPARVLAAAASTEDSRARPGPPGAPRVLTVGQRNTP